MNCPYFRVCIVEGKHQICDDLQREDKKNIVQQNQCSGSGIRCLFDSWIRDPGWVESQHPDRGSGMNNPDHIF
jgi:hypothetical protein